MSRVTNFEKAKEHTKLMAENKRLRAALQGVEPYVDAIVCYASTMGEHKPNRIAVNVRRALKGEALSQTVP